MVSTLRRSGDVIELHRLVVHDVDRGFFGARSAAVDPDVGRNELSPFRTASITERHSAVLCLDG